MKVAFVFLSTTGEGKRQDRDSQCYRLSSLKLVYNKNLCEIVMHYNMASEKLTIDCTGPSAWHWLCE